MRDDELIFRESEGVIQKWYDDTCDKDAEKMYCPKFRKLKKMSYYSNRLCIHEPEELDERIGLSKNHHSSLFFISMTHKEHYNA